MTALHGMASGFPFALIFGTAVLFLLYMAFE